MPPLSAQDVLEQARVNIQAAREAQDSDRVIKHYQTAKNALTKVDVAKADVESLTEMFAGFEDLAGILDNWDVDRAVKCRKRAGILRQELDKRNRTIKAAIDLSLLCPGLPQIARSSLSGGTTSTVSFLSSPTATTITPLTFISDTSEDTSDERAVHTASSATRQQAPSSQRAIVSVLAATGSAANLLPFSKKAAPASLNWHLPSPGTDLKNTCQLAYCLALLQEPVDESLLDPATLEWRLNTKEHPGERHRLETLAKDVIAAFFVDPLKHPVAIAEVVQVAPVLDKTYFRSLLCILVKTVSEPGPPHLHAMEGLARVIQGTTPGSINSDDLKVTLEALHTRLTMTHTQSSGHLCQVLLAISQILDAMGLAQVGDVSRDTLHKPLTDLLQELESHQDRYVAFQAKYASRALLDVTDDDNVWRAGLRRGWLVMKVAAGFAKMPDLKDIKDALDATEKLYVAGKGVVRLIKNTKEAIKTGDMPTFNANEGLKFKWSWYQPLRYAEKYIQSGDLIRFQELVTTAPCRHQLMFQMGICQLLGRFAVDTQWDLEARQGAVAFLEALYRDVCIWIPHKRVHQVIFDLISIMDFNAAKTLRAKWQQENATLVPLSNPPSHAWSDILSLSSTDEALPASALLRAVQSKKQQETHLAEIYNHVRPSYSSPEKIQSALKTHYSPNLKILRISGEDSEIDICAVNLAIVEAPAQRKKEKQELKKQAAVFHRVPSSEAVRGSNIESSIRLEQLFDKRKLRDGKEGIPQRILVQGRAGIGKTTLCKKIVYLHQSGLWAGRFKAVLWLPLRRLRGTTCRNLEKLLREKVFTSQLDREHKELAHTLAAWAKEGNVLFILDGLDEIATDVKREDSSIKELLRELLDNEHVVITSRPSGLDASLLRSIDLELETIGFSQEDVKEFIDRALKPGPARTVQDFIQQTPLIQGLVNIPVQLDVICFCWESLPQGGSQITITGLYQLMSRKLWCKDAVRLEKGRGGKPLTEKQINRLTQTPKAIDRLMSTELRHLGHLAFKGLRNNHQIEFDEAALLDAFEDLADTDSTDDNSPYSSEVLDMVKETSFLHSADADLDTSKKPSQQTWSFVHLTFQEYFAATWIASKMTAAGDEGHSLSAGSMKNEPTVRFVHEHKYSPRFEIVWWMVAGLLEGGALEKFFDLLQGGPRDLIGGRHQQLLAACLNEARSRLDPAIVAEYDLELTKWLKFEMQTCQHDRDSISRLGSQHSFPEVILVERLGPDCPWKSILMNTLGARSTLSDSAIQFLIDALKDDDEYFRSSAALSLSKQSTLSESAVMSIFVVLNNEDGSPAPSVVCSQFSLSESEIQTFIDKLKNVQNEEDERVREALRQCEIAIFFEQFELSNLASQSLTDALEDEDEDAVKAAVLELRSLSTLKHSVMTSLIDIIVEEDPDWYEDSFGDADEHAFWDQEKGAAMIEDHIWEEEEYDVRNHRALAARALGNKTSLSESATRSLIAALKNGEEYVNRSAASWVLRSQTSLSESTIHLFIAALKDEDELVRYTASRVLCSQTSLSESAIHLLIAALKDEEEYVMSTAASTLAIQSTLPESAIHPLVTMLNDGEGDTKSSVARALSGKTSLAVSAIQSLIVALKDEERCVRYTASWVLQSQISLSESAIHLLIAALRDEGYVKSSAVRALDKQSTLPESVIHSVVAALKDDDKDVRIMAADALGKQPALTGSAIQSLIATLKDDDKDVRYSVSEALYRHCLSLCIAYPRLTENEMVCVYKNHLFPYSCQHIISLQVRDRRLCWHTERGPIQTGPLQSDEEELINSTFAAVQREAGLL